MIGGRFGAQVSVVLLAVALNACGGAGSPSGVATNPPVVNGSGSSSSTPSSGGLQSSGARTVLSPIGLNLRSSGAPTAPAVGTAARGTLLTVLDHSDANGGWYKVSGQTTTGWITADPDLTAPGHFSIYQSDLFAFGVLYPDQWTFANEAADVVFKPQSGTQVILARPAPSLAALGPSGRAGYAANTQTEQVVCGATGTVVGYDRQGGAAPSGSGVPSPSSPAGSGAPAPAPTPELAHFSQMRLRLDPAHFLELDYNYDAPDQLQIFKNFYNSVTFPFPQCTGPVAPSPVVPTPVPGAPL